MFVRLGGEDGRLKIDVLNFIVLCYFVSQTGCDDLFKPHFGHDQLWACSKSGPIHGLAPRKDPKHSPFTKAPRKINGKKSGTCSCGELAVLLWLTNPCEIGHGFGEWDCRDFREQQLNEHRPNMQNHWDVSRSRLEACYYNNTVPCVHMVYETAILQTLGT